ncbi:hypothetical protein AUJ17_03845 [Candidatus Micrarchaeota archaeon CG1_02_47_40]|nr:MAG: hypothetical protein AUJ17_03845 [Candidatus Micrarchaeota archaeon CG1_02_47_40]
MNKKASALFLFLILASFLYADISVSSYSILPSTVRPGVTGSISVTILNSGSNATSVTAEPTGISPILAAGRVSLGDFSSGITTSFSIPFRVEQNAQAGVYNLPIRLAYFSYSLGNTLSGTKTLTVPITVRNPASFQLSAFSKTAFSDDDFNVQGKISNEGGRAYDAKLYINSTSFYAAGPTPLLLGDVSNETPFSLNITVASGVQSGKYSIPLTITYRDQIGGEYSETLYLNANLKVRSPQFILTLTPQEGELTPGRQAKLIAKLQNTGDKAAYSVKMKILSTDTLTPLSSSEIIAGDIPADSQKEVSFDVGVKNIEPGFYPISVQISYMDDNGKSETPQTLSSGLNILGTNDISVFISSRPSPIVSGGAHTFSVLVSNIGSSSIKALQVKPAGGVFKIMDAQGEQFIGGLQQDDFSSVQYKILVENVAEGSYPFSVESTFKDAYNNEHKANSTVMLEVVSPATAQKLNGTGGDNTLLCIGAALILLVAGGIYYFKFYRHGKKLFFKKKD